MTRIVWLKSLLAVVVAVTAALVVCQSASAQKTQPFRIKGAGVVEFVPFTITPPTNKATHVADGVATFIGRHSSRGIVQVLSLNFATGIGTFQSAVPVVFRGENGTLAYWYGRVDKGAPGPGVVQLIPLNDGTGRVRTRWDAIFTLAAPAKNVAASSFRMIAESDPFVFGTVAPVRYHWRGEGTITFRR